MAKNNLAGLAALGALGMMMSKGKGKDAPTQVEEPGEINERMDRANAISRGRTDLVDTGMSTPEPDENYRNTGPRTEPVGVSSAPRVRSSSPKIGGYTSDAEQIASANVPPPSDRVRRIAELGGVKMNPRIQRDELGEPLYKKKGGVIKMAKGGMTSSSASRRADGIAQKGKTRGKIC